MSFIDEISMLGVTKRLQLMEDIWETIAAEPENLPVSHLTRMIGEREKSGLLFDAVVFLQRPSRQCAVETILGQILQSPNPA